MSTLEHPEIGPREGHANNKAVAALVLGIFAMANVVAMAILFAASISGDVGSDGWWLLLPFAGFLSGLIAAYLGSIGWIDVRRGVTDRRLFEAQFGALLGGVAALLIMLAVILVFLFAILLAISFGADGTGGWD